MILTIWKRAKTNTEFQHVMNNINAKEISEASQKKRASTTSFGNFLKEMPQKRNTFYLP